MKKLLNCLLIIFTFITFSIISYGENYQKEILDIINNERIENNLLPLEEKEILNEMAIKKASLVAKEGKLDHYAGGYSSLGEFFKEYGISYLAIAENLARNQKTPEDVAKNWIESKGHRANLLNPQYTYTGIGKFIDENNNIYWVQLFLKERSKK